MGQLNSAKEDYDTLSESDLVNITGCLPSCDRFDISLENTPEIRSWPGGNHPTMTLSFQFEDGSYEVEEEYIVYDTSNFIADVGGYLGLLMGQSILRFYYFCTGLKIGKYV